MRATLRWGKDPRCPFCQAGVADWRHYVFHCQAMPKADRPPSMPDCLALAGSVPKGYINRPTNLEMQREERWTWCSQGSVTITVATDGVCAKNTSGAQARVGIRHRARTHAKQVRRRYGAMADRPTRRGAGGSTRSLRRARGNPHPHRQQVCGEHPQQDDWRWQPSGEAPRLMEPHMGAPGKARRSHLGESTPHPRASLAARDNRGALGLEQAGRPPSHPGGAQSHGRPRSLDTPRVHAEGGPRVAATPGEDLHESQDARVARAKPEWQHPPVPTARTMPTTKDRQNGSDVGVQTRHREAPAWERMRPLRESVPGCSASQAPAVEETLRTDCFP